MNKATKITSDTNSLKAQVLIVDDHPLVRRGIAELLSSQPDFEVAAEVGDASEAMSVITGGKIKVDVAIIDIALTDGDGIDLIKQIRAQNETIKLLVASMHDESLYAERALHAGAKGYVAKDAGTEQFVTAVRQVLKGKVYLSPRMTERLLHRVVEGGPEELSKSPIESLSDRELEVFRLIGEGLSTREIGERLHLSTKTIDTYREHIKRKLNLRNSVELIRRAVQWVIESH